MATASQLSGALLEEVVLFLLRISGYEPVQDSGSDTSLAMGPAGLSVRGRGCNHQIDGIADFRYGQPFSNPQRLLVEAKAYDSTRAVGLDVIRNAVGVLKDASEFWVPGLNQSPPRHRYHYQYAVFSTTGFSVQAQRYAYAQDIYLLPLAKSQFFLPIVRALDEAVAGIVRPGGKISVEEFRELRNHLRDGLSMVLSQQDAELDDERLRPLLRATRRQQYDMLAMASKRFPFFLAPRSPDVVGQLRPVETVRIRRDDEGWFLQRRHEDERLFSFDIPLELLELYVRGEHLSSTAVLQMKQDALSVFHAFSVNPDPRIITFQLDQEWWRNVLSQRKG